VTETPLNAAGTLATKKAASVHAARNAELSTVKMFRIRRVIAIRRFYPAFRLNG